MISHDFCRDQLGEYLDQGLAATERDEVAAHLAGCADCAAIARQLAGIRDTLRNAQPVSAPPQLRRNVRAALQNEARQNEARSRAATRTKHPFLSWKVPQLAWSGTLATGALALIVLTRPFSTVPQLVPETALAPEITPKTAPRSAAPKPQKSAPSRAANAQKAPNPLPERAAPKTAISAAPTQSDTAPDKRTPAFSLPERPLSVAPVPITPRQSPPNLTSENAKINPPMPRAGVQNRENAPSTRAVSPKIAPERRAASQKLGQATDASRATAVTAPSGQPSRRSDSPLFSSQLQVVPATGLAAPDADSLSPASRNDLAGGRENERAPKTEAPVKSTPTTNTFAGATAPSASAPSASAPRAATHNEESANPSRMRTSRLAPAQTPPKIGAPNTEAPAALSAPSLPVVRRFELRFQVSKRVENARIRLEIAEPAKLIWPVSTVVKSGNFQPETPVLIPISLANTLGGEKISVFLEQKTAGQGSKILESQTLIVPDAP